MSNLITSCPACGIRFKLVPDQLKVSDGWVRCGQCREIFDASARIEQPASSAVRQVPLLTEEWAPASPPSTPADEPAIEAPAAAFFPEAPVPQAVQATAAETGQPAPPHPLANEPIEADSPALAPANDAPAPPAAIPSKVIDIVVDEPDPDAMRASLGFIRKAERRARWNKPWVHASLALTSLLLLLTLVAQVIYTDKNRLAALYPTFAPAIVSACELMQCTVSPYQDPEAVAIESTKFQKIASTPAVEAFELELLLKSRAAHPVAWPALELSLTNSQDQIVLRKVLLPAQYANADFFAPLSERSIRTAIQVQHAALPSKVSGYRVLLFYP